jgi:NEDD4-binding protein 2
MSKLVLMRGIPGSGKSTKANQIKDDYILKGYQAEIFSTDDFWMRNGCYEWNRDLLGTAHKWNQIRVENAIKDDIDYIIVDNTNLSSFDVGPYFNLAVKYGIEIEIVNIDTPVQTCIDRQINRSEDRRISKEAIEYMASKMTTPIDIALEIKKAKIRNSIVRL